MRLLQSGCLTLLCAAAMMYAGGGLAEETSSSCNGPPVTAGAPASVVSTPDYAAGASEDAPPDAQAEAELKGWHDYRTSIFETLRDSPAPRDWALATLGALDFSSQSESRRDGHATLLQRAVAAAPDDPLVLWIAVMQSHLATATVGATTPLQRLQQLEPDNAAVWLETLMPAYKRHDVTAVDKALNRMAASSRFDGHIADLEQALLQAFQRVPPPANMPTDDDVFQSARAVPYVYATAITSAAALPAFQNLLAACRVDPRTGANAYRSVDCAATGHLMTGRGDTQITNRIGMSLLRVSRTFVADDVHEARAQDWLREQFTTKVLASVGAPSPSSVDEMINYQRDWIETGSELEALRRAVVRAGMPAAPPDDWIDKLSPFSEERLQQDQVALEHTAVKS